MIPSHFDEEIPRWDVALEALINEEHRNLGRPLGLGDFQRLSHQYAIRFDDMMVTLFELVINGKWRYHDEEGRQVDIDRAQFEHMASNGRIEVGDVSGYTGAWQPCI